MLTLAAPRPGRAEVTLPGDKSITHRALMLASIAAGRTRIVNPNLGDDVGATVRALRLLGVSVRNAGDDFEVVGARAFRNPINVIDCGNSGTTMRMLAGLLAGRVNAVLDGDASLRRRPMARVTNPLNKMGAGIRAGPGGRPPVRLRSRAAPLVGIHYTLPVASAQVKSALLFAGLRATGRTIVTSPNRTRDHSERLLRALGARLRVRGKTIAIWPSSLRSPGQIRIPGDFSAAVYLLCAAAVLPGCALCLRDVGVNPTRTAALDVMRKMGARIEVQRPRTWSGEPVANLTVVGGSPLRGVSLPRALVPILIDEIPALSALAATADGVFQVRSAAELKVKESNRIQTTVELLRRFGVDARALPNGIVVRGSRAIRAPASITTYGDHRVGMAAAILAAAAQTSIKIRNGGCIATSFPGFTRTWRLAFG